MAVSMNSTKTAPRIIGSTPFGGGVQHFWMKKGEAQLSRIDRADGIYLWDTEGRRYIDMSSGPAVCNLGHNNANVLKAMAAQASRVTYCYPTAFESEANTELSNLLCSLTGPGLERAFFVSGGSEAVEMCLKFARYHALATGKVQKCKIISRVPSYHGNTLGALSLTGEGYVEPLFSDMLRLMPKVPLPMSYRWPEGFGNSESHAEYCLTCLEEEILAQDPDKVLAFIMEPVTGVAGGAMVAPDFYYQRVREICDRHDVLLIYDEVMSGVGRTGKYLAAHHWPDARPDIIALAKGFSGGYYPLGAMVVADRLLEPVVEQGGFHMGHTYKSNPLGCAVGKAVLEEIIDKDLIANAAIMGDYLAKRLGDIQKNIAILGDVRGKGLLIAIEIVADKKTKASLPSGIDVIGRIVNIARELGLLIYARKNSGSGNGDWLMVTPPLIITQAQIDEMIELLSQTLQRFQDELNVNN